MCGRFVSTNSVEEIAGYFGASFEAEEIPANYNVAPTQDVLAVVSDGSTADGAPALAVRAFHWGLVPSWAKDVKIGSSMINARSETIADKPAFKAVFKKHRCIIPMSGFYEWRAAQADGPVNAKGKPLKQPMFIHRVDGEPLAVAGVWSAWRDKAGPRDAPWLHSCAVITTSANNTMSSVHDRMPVILPASKWHLWLDPTVSDTDVLREMLQPAPDDLLTMHKVSTDVNNVRNTGAHLIDTLPEEPAEPQERVSDDTDQA
jgi:putative SOS response-associated peptidase YedK